MYGCSDMYMLSFFFQSRSLSYWLRAPFGLQAFKDGDIRFLICTDVAARGIDISGLPYLINMTLPDRSEDYIHRVGRVGQALVKHQAASFSYSTPKQIVFFNSEANLSSNESHVGSTKLLINTSSLCSLWRPCN